MKPQGDGRVRCSAWLGGTGLVVMCGVLLDAKCARGELCIGGAGCLCPRHQRAHRHGVEGTAASATHLANVKPFDALGDLRAATEAACANTETLHRATGSKRTDGIAHRMTGGLQPLDECVVEHSERGVPPNDQRSATGPADGNNNTAA